MPDHEPLWKQHYPCFAERGEPAIQRLKEAARLVRLSAGQTVFHPGSPCANYLLVVEGEVRVQMTTPGGREVLLYRVRPGNACILTTSCLLGGNGYPADGIAESPTLAFAVPEPEFRRALGQSEFFRGFVFADFAQRLASVIGRMEELMSGSIDPRLAKALLAGADKGLVRKTHQELALETGSAREVVSRHLQRYQREGWVRLGRASVEVLNADALAGLIDHPMES